MEDRLTMVFFGVYGLWWHNRVFANEDGRSGFFFSVFSGPFQLFMGSAKMIMQDLYVLQNC